MRKRLETALLHLILICGGFIMVLPFYWMVTSALKGPAEVALLPPTWFPREFVWSNFADAWKAAPFGRFFFNSLFVATSVTLGQLVTATLAAYALARRKFPGRELIFYLLMATLMIPDEVTIIPAYLIVRNLDWVNSYKALIVPSLSGAFSIFLLRQFFLNMPKDLEEAAALDGSAGLHFIWYVLVPLSKPAMAALSLFTFLGSWNSYLWPMIVTNSTEMRPIQVALRYFMDADLGNQWPQLMAASTMVVAPVLGIFLLAQRQFIEGITFSGIKG